MRVPFIFSPCPCHVREEKKPLLHRVTILVPDKSKGDSWPPENAKKEKKTPFVVVVVYTNNEHEQSKTSSVCTQHTQSYFG